MHPTGLALIALGVFAVWIAVTGRYKDVFGQLTQSSAKKAK
jgi:hypothetical protein